jgi:hypothetical protein
LKKRIYIINLIVCLIFILLILTGCSSNIESSNKIKDKVSSEVGFIENEICTISLKYAKGEYYVNGAFDWKNIYTELLKINNSWSSIVLDLNQLNISQDLINSLGQELSNMLIAVSNQNTFDMLNCLNNIYIKLPEIEKLYLENDAIVEEITFKSLLISTYRYAENKDWNNAKIEAQNVSNKYNELMNDIDYAENNIYNLNKVLVEIEELKSAINTENIDLVKLKFINSIAYLF